MRLYEKFAHMTNAMQNIFIYIFYILFDSPYICTDLWKEK